MAAVKGFRGLRFVGEKAGALDDVWTPPYDVISSEERQTLMRRNAHSMVHLILPEERSAQSRYAHAAGLFRSWTASGVLRADADDSFYLLEQRFAALDGSPRVRRALLGLVKLPEPGESIILGHERTFAGPIEDRYRLLEATEANLEVVFALYADPEDYLPSLLAPHFDCASDQTGTTLDGVTQRLWQIPYDARVSAFLRDKRLYIADGHHRFAMARGYRDARRTRSSSSELQPWDYLLMGFVSFDDPGLLIYPPHRLLNAPHEFDPERFLRDLAPWFDVTSVDGDLVARVKAQDGCAMGLVMHDGGQRLLVLRDVDRATWLGADRGSAWRDLDVAVLHRGILERLLGLDETAELVYERSAERAMETVRRGEKQLGFILKPVRPEQIRACAEAGEPMPPKSTYFFPKLPSGPVIYRHT